MFYILYQVVSVPTHFSMRATTVQTDATTIACKAQPAITGQRNLQSTQTH